MESLPWQDWAQEASEEFGSDFRRKFGIGWVYDKAAVPRGRKNRADMQTAYNSIWLALDALHPTLHPEGSQLSDWPQWPAEREFHNAVPTLLSRQKPLGETVNLLYSSWVIQYCERLWHSKGGVQAIVDATPAMIVDHTYHQFTQRGIRNPEEDYALAGVHTEWVPEGSVAAGSNEEHPSLAWRYCAVQQRIQIGLRESAALRHTLSMVSWNAGAARQRLDVGLFCSKSFVCGAIQEANDEVYQQLLRHGCRVFRPNNEDITAWVFIGDQFLEGGEVIHEHLRTDAQGRWILTATFVHLRLKAPHDWGVREVTLGSAHLNNVVAKSPDVATQVLDEFLTLANQYNVDLIGCDLNQGICPRKREISPYHAATIAVLDRLKFQKRMPIDLLGTAASDCVGWIMCPWSSFRGVKLARHGAIDFQPLDVGIRRFDGDSHHPSFLFFEMSNKRARTSAGWAARQERKKQNLAVKKTMKRNRS
jgi:hypothetical protein